MRWNYANFDKWVSFMINEVGIKGQISCYTMIPWNMKIRYLDEATGNTSSWTSSRTILPTKPSGDLS